MAENKSALQQIRSELDSLSAQGLRRRLRTVTGPQRSETTLDSQPTTILCSNNYLGLADDLRLQALAVEAIREYGCSSGASRLISGTMSLHRQLEKELAAFKGTEGALVYNCGYMANLGVLATVVGDGDAVYSDALNHASIVDGCRLSRAVVNIYRHGDVQHLADLLAAGSAYRRRLIVTDSVFSMDGDLAPLPEIVALAQKYDALLLVDDAHATGVLGDHGRGSGSHFSLPASAIDLLMGTLGKALGSYGAFVAGRQEYLDYLTNKSRPFIYTTALPPAVLGASLAAVRVLQNEPGLVAELRKKILYTRSRLRDLGFTVPDDPTPIIPIIVGDAGRTMELSEKFLAAGIFIQGIRPPTVEAGKSRLRVTITRDLSWSRIDEILAVFASFRDLFPPVAER
ncbi:MAG: 8-amino-7-oxononanoate synthase [Deltaproteobacteria bacterium]|nr:8-amino-7-oxononanoate synthase [Candidatus Anaeroferrophillus wilburensis]MBN2888086.1 8-amino-7-oxononanoate synthase [Deltaproteobacteria bacterium]